MVECSYEEVSILADMPSGPLLWLVCTGQCTHMAAGSGGIRRSSIGSVVCVGVKLLLSASGEK